MLFAQVLPNGNGGYTVIPKKPLREVSAAGAARILGCSRAHVANLVNHPAASSILRWRWTSEKHGKRLFDLDSVLEYRAATRDPEFGDGRSR